MITVRELLQRTSLWFGGKGLEPARLEAEVLLAHVLDIGRMDLYTGADRPVEERELDRYRELVRRRAQGEPSAYLTGRREFYGLEFEVTRDVLVPRPETEMLVDRVRALAPARLLDVGTGSGCIAVACAKRLPATTVTATDLSPRALAVARRNAERHDAAIRFFEGDLYEPLDANERFDVIVSNPPYVADGAVPELDAHEPKEALYAGKHGMAVIERLVDGAAVHLEEEGTLLLEIGEDQGDRATEHARTRFREVALHRDLAGHPRALEACGVSC